MSTIGTRLSPTRRLRALRDEFDRAIFVLALGDLGILGGRGAAPNLAFLRNLAAYARSAK